LLSPVLEENLCKTIQKKQPIFAPSKESSSSHKPKQLQSQLRDSAYNGSMNRDGWFTKEPNRKSPNLSTGTVRRTLNPKLVWKKRR
jgi:hypothetical protein